MHPRFCVKHCNWSSPPLLGLYSFYSSMANDAYRPPLDLELEEGTDECVDSSYIRLIGKILTSKALNKQAITHIILEVWKTRAKITISSWPKNVFLFRFGSEEDRALVLRNAPWSVMGNLLVLQPLPVGKAISEMDFSYCPFWIQVHGLPMDKMTRRNGQIIANSIGKLIGVEAPTEGLLLARSRQSGYGLELKTRVARNLGLTVEYYRNQINEMEKSLRPILWRENSQALASREKMQGTTDEAQPNTTTTEASCLQLPHYSTLMGQRHRLCNNIPHVAFKQEMKQICTIRSREPMKPEVVIQSLLRNNNPKTRAVWFGSDLGFLLGYGVISSAKEWTLSIMEHCVNDRERKERVGIAAVVGWFIWKARNE
ncbi:hypothetical protein LOK49_LG02G02730 [Camellia lanceoleosa]|uniref:Uncharacterized protein n=1 Tax=Camellia lanceoleosa TaxID=1840588 RepID=A0ACC0IJR0_9ERIC|nr:hypothetical protein LOK49_LG02G02730 [Camellia lanceoleosa]